MYHSGIRCVLKSIENVQVNMEVMLVDKFLWCCPKTKKEDKFLWLMFFNVPREKHKKHKKPRLWKFETPWELKIVTKASGTRNIEE